MTSEQFEAFLAQAGVDAGAVGAAERLLLPEPQVDEARTARDRRGVRAGAGCCTSAATPWARPASRPGSTRTRARWCSRRARIWRSASPSRRTVSRESRGTGSTWRRIDRPPSGCGPWPGRWRSARSTRAPSSCAWCTPGPRRRLRTTPESRNDSGVEPDRTTPESVRTPESFVPLPLGRDPRRRPDRARHGAGGEPGRDDRGAPLDARAHRRPADADRALRDRPGAATSPRASIACRRTSAPPTRRSTSPGRRCAGIATTSRASACCCARPARDRR